MRARTSSRWTVVKRRCPREAEPPAQLQPLPSTSTKSMNYRFIRRRQPNQEPTDQSIVLPFEVQDNNLLSSETCVHFLLKLLNPPVNVVDAKAPSIGSKLLGIGKFQMLNGSNKDVDSCSEDILSKVEEILLSCKEIKPADRDYKRTTRPELCSKWLALLTMEKACLSVVALEDTSDMVLELGGNFKETLRQLGGLDDIFNVMVNCHSELEVRPYLCVCMFSNSLYKTIKLALFVILFCYGKGWLTFEPCTIHAPVYLELQSDEYYFEQHEKTCCKTRICCSNCFG
ncbi:wings apart-like protein 1 isoform X1 [Zea mays]|uniref:wings apart-like protein 1 isoform X1 n=1 Tax=Zea mays TaxID=4577 RepID=UPI0004DE80FD|nr:wings apart-like protein 1 isoform X1 [Zea mays]|eukprot:XP_008645136.1 uncharacterized protein LOC103626501 isoform X1 [Zea mays]